MLEDDSNAIIIADPHIHYHETKRWQSRPYQKIFACEAITSNNLWSFESIQFGYLHPDGEIVFLTCNKTLQAWKGSDMSDTFAADRQTGPTP